MYSKVNITFVLMNIEQIQFTEYYQPIGKVNYTLGKQ
jgi:hypothetical protein